SVALHQPRLGCLLEDSPHRRAHRLVLRPHCMAPRNRSKSAHLHKVSKRAARKEINVLDAELLKRRIQVRTVAAGIRDFQLDSATIGKERTKPRDSTAQIANVLHDADQDQEIIGCFRLREIEDSALYAGDAVERLRSAHAARRWIGAE